MTKPMGQAAPFTKMMLQKMENLLKRDGCLRDLALMSVAKDTCLRASDLLSLRVGDVRPMGGGIRRKFTIRQKKTGSAVECYLTKKTQSVVTDFIGHLPVQVSEFLFPGGRGGGSLTVRQYERLVKNWCVLLRQEGIEIDPSRYSTHSFRRSRTSYMVEQAAAEGHSITLETAVGLQKLLGHEKLDSTIRYLNLPARMAERLANRYEL